MVPIPSGFGPVRFGGHVNHSLWCDPSREAWGPTLRGMVVAVEHVQACMSYRKHQHLSVDGVLVRNEKRL